MEIYEFLTYAKCTQHPNVFLKTYWGNHRLRKCNNPVSEGIDKIITNRNNFITTYNIKDYHRGISRKHMIKAKLVRDNGDIRDHIEYYKCNDKTILAMFSKHCRNEDEHNFILSEGYIQIDSMYVPEQNTYIKML